MSMFEFLSQFKILQNFAVEHRDLKLPQMLSEAKRLGYVRNWEPPKGCTYYGTAICTLKGRLFLKRIKDDKDHPLEQTADFYDYITDPKATGASGRDWPYRADSYILISAGADGLYGTSDDITNF